MKKDTQTQYICIKGFKDLYSDRCRKGSIRTIDSYQNGRNYFMNNRSGRGKQIEIPVDEFEQYFKEYIVYKVGDKIRITAEIHGHGFEIGAIGQIIEVNPNPTTNRSNYTIECEGNDNYWFLEEEEFELYTPPLVMEKYLSGKTESVDSCQPKIKNMIALAITDEKDILAIHNVVSQDIKTQIEAAYPHLFKPASLKVVLTDDYTAEVFKDYIQVGCQKIDIKTVYYLVNEHTSVWGE